MKRTVINILFLVLAFSSFAQKKYYVKPDGAPSLPGTSWGWASNNLQAVVDKAVSGDIVYVAVGTYSGGFVMKEGVTVLGGYTANSANITERYNLMETTDPAKQSILDGGGVQRVLTQVAPFSVPTQWEGFVIQNGKPAVEFKKGSVIYSSNGGNQIVGVLYKYDPASKSGMIISREEIRTQWGGYGTQPANLSVQVTADEAKKDVSGLAGSEKIRAALGEHSADWLQETTNGNYAAYWCDTLNTGGYTDWYLPAAGELQEVQEAGILSAMKNVGKDVLNGYWTSSQVGNTLAWAYYFGGNGHFHPALKYIYYMVSAVHPFRTSGEPDGIYVAGGGVFLGNNGKLENCIVKNNTSPSLGGGVYVGAGGQLINCVVESNTAPEGKEIYYEIPLGIHLAVNGQPLVYPNPVRAGEKLTIRLNTNMSVNYQLVNAAGWTVKKGILQAEENTLNMPSQKGVYLLTLYSKNVNYQSKILIK